jgi:hypothetical protein
MGPVELRTKNYCAYEDQRQFLSRSDWVPEWEWEPGESLPSRGGMTRPVLSSKRRHIFKTRISLERTKIWSCVLKGSRKKNDYAGEDQQQFTGLDWRTATVCVCGRVGQLVIECQLEKPSVEGSGQEQLEPYFHWRGAPFKTRKYVEKENYGYGSHYCAGEIQKQVNWPTEQLVLCAVSSSWEPVTSRDSQWVARKFRPWEFARQSPAGKHMSTEPEESTFLGAVTTQ